jgi:hypothetical protein
MLRLFFDRLIAAPCLYSSVESDGAASNGASFEHSTDPCCTTLAHEEAMRTSIRRARFTDPATA